MTTVAELSALVGGRVVRGDPHRIVRRLSPTNLATEDSLTFVTKPEYLQYLESTTAAAVLLTDEVAARADLRLADGLAVVAVKDAYVAFARAAQALHGRVPGPEGVHPSAVIDPSAQLGEGVSAGPFVYVGPMAKVGRGAVLHAGAHVEAEAEVGPGAVLYNHVVVRHGCTVGARCILHPGVVIGADGFGFAREVGADPHALTHVKIPQIGGVIVEDDVEIGANSCVDRGALGATRIGAGTKIDNLVQVAHNVEIGAGSILVAQCGIAGSSRLGRAVIVAAQAGVAGHVQVGDGAKILGQSGVTSNLEPDAEVGGSPAFPKRDYFRAMMRLRMLDSLFGRVKKLERQLAKDDGET